MPGKLRKIGIWIDHRQAVIVAVEDDAIEVETVESGLDGQGGWIEDGHRLLALAGRGSCGIRSCRVYRRSCVSEPGFASS